VAKLQHIVNKKQQKEVYSISVPIEIIKLLGLKKGQEFAVAFNQEKKSIEYIPIRK
jgi:hypothetical protein